MGESQQWNPGSWRRYPVKQQPHYPSADELQRVEREISSLGAIVSHHKTARLTQALSRAADGEVFFLHAGDCAERFEHSPYSVSQQKYLGLMMMALYLELIIHKPVMVIGRIGGQFAKPRSQLYEDGDVPIFRGDNVHQLHKTKAAREPDPERLRQGYHQAKIIADDLELLDRQMSSEVFLAELLKCVSQLPSESAEAEWGERLQNIYHGELHIPSRPRPLFISHEALLLGYEQAMTHPYDGLYYNHGAHFLWLGNRTRSLDGGHVEYLRGIANPVGIKLGPETTAGELEGYLTKLNPESTPGKLVLITRFGFHQAAEKLSELIGVVDKIGIPVLWFSDPMHGQVVLTEWGQKTRYVDDIQAELHLVSQILAEHNHHLSGIHLETTHERVRECIWRHEPLEKSSLTPYTSACDPRLTITQALHVMSSANLLSIPKML